MIYIIIPVFNRKEFTQQCLNSLNNQTFSGFKIVIVDDGSTDGTPEMLTNEYPDVICLKGNGNLWWTASVNMGIEYALRNGAKLIMTLNNDTVASKDFVENMIKWSKKVPDALLGAFAIDYNSKKPLYGGGNFDWLTASINPSLDDLNADKLYGLHPVDHFPGRGLLIPKTVFDNIGLFNQKLFPHYFADYDFTHQAVKNGFRIYCNYDAKLYIYPEESGDKKNREMKSLRNYYNHLFGIRGGGNLKNFTRFAMRNCPKIYLPVFLSLGYIKRFFGYFIK